MWFYILMERFGPVWGVSKWIEWVSLVFSPHGVVCGIWQYLGVGCCAVQSGVRVGVLWRGRSMLVCGSILLRNKQYVVLLHASQAKWNPRGPLSYPTILNLHVRRGICVAAYVCVCVSALFATFSKISKFSTFAKKKISQIFNFYSQKVDFRANVFTFSISAANSSLFVPR